MIFVLWACVLLWVCLNDMKKKELPVWGLFAFGDLNGSWVVLEVFRL